MQHDIQCSRQEINGIEGRPHLRKFIDFFFTIPSRSLLTAVLKKIYTNVEIYPLEKIRPLPRKHLETFMERSKRISSKMKKQYTCVPEVCVRGAHADFSWGAPKKSFEPNFNCMKQKNSLIRRTFCHIEEKFCLIEEIFGVSGIFF